MKNVKETKTKESVMKDVKETVTKENEVAKEQKGTTTSGRYLSLWKENSEGKFRPLPHQFGVVDGKFELEIEKNSKMDTTKINITYMGKDGLTKFSIGAYTKQLGKVWVGVPELVKRDSECEVH